MVDGPACHDMRDTGSDVSTGSTNVPPDIKNLLHGSAAGADCVTGRAITAMIDAWHRPSVPITPWFCFQAARIRRPVSHGRCDAMLMWRRSAFAMASGT